MWWVAGPVGLPFRVERSGGDCLVDLSCGLLVGPALGDLPVLQLAELPDDRGTVPLDVVVGEQFTLGDRPGDPGAADQAEREQPLLRENRCSLGNPVNGGA